MDEVEETAKAVYGMIHARFLVTNAGLEARFVSSFCDSIALEIQGLYLRNLSASLL